MFTVTNDECLIDLAIVDATAVIHFGIPGSKTKFGARLACMKNYFYDVTNIDEVSTVDLGSPVYLWLLFCFIHLSERDVAPW